MVLHEVVKQNENLFKSLHVSGINYKDVMGMYNAYKLYQKKRQETDQKKATIVKEIASEMNCTPKTVYLYLEKMNRDLRYTPDDSDKNLVNRIKLILKE